MLQIPLESLLEDLRLLLGCAATSVGSVPVKQALNRQTMPKGAAQVFTHYDPPEATRCCAWCLATEGSAKWRIVAVLQQDPVNTAEAAVRASFVQEHRECK